MAGFRYILNSLHEVREAFLLVEFRRCAAGVDGHAGGAAAGHEDSVDEPRPVELFAGERPQPVGDRLDGLQTGEDLVGAVARSTSWCVPRWRSSERRELACRAASLSVAAAGPRAIPPSSLARRPM